MTTRNIKNRLNIITSLQPVVRTTNAAGDPVDILGYDACCIHIQIGSYTAGEHKFIIQESSDNTTWHDVVSSDLGDEIESINEANQKQLISYLGMERYLRVNLAVTGTDASASSMANIICAYPNHAIA